MAFYEAMNPADITVEMILPIIRKFLPETQSDSVQFFYHGTYNVFEIDQKYFARVADREFRNAKGIEMLQREEEILSFLKNKLPLTIPEILFLNDLNNIPLSIHEKIPGRSLVFVYEQFGSKQKQRIGKEIGEFLSVLH